MAVGIKPLRYSSIAPTPIEFNLLFCFRELKLRRSFSCQSILSQIILRRILNHPRIWYFFLQENHLLMPSAVSWNNSIFQNLKVYVPFSFFYNISNSNSFWKKAFGKSVAFFLVGFIKNLINEIKTWTWLNRTDWLCTVTVNESVSLLLLLLFHVFSFL